MGVSMGAQLRPESSTLSPYWRKMQYRFGIRYNQTYLELNDNQLNEFGISFGSCITIDENQIQCKHRHGIRTQGYNRK
jgi:hypothetical protein